MKLDLTKVVSGSPCWLEPKELIIDGIVKLGKASKIGITCFPNMTPYKELGLLAPIPYTYDDHKNSVDIQWFNTDGSVIKNVAIYANADGTMDCTGDGYACFTSGSKKVRFAHLSYIFEGSVKKGDLIAKTGNVGANNYHLHIYVEDRSIDTISKMEYISTTTPPKEETEPTTTKTFKAVRSGKSTDNGTFYFDEKYYNDFKDKKQSASAVDTTGSTWAKDTTWTEVYAPSGSTPSTPPSAYELSSYYSGGWKKDTAGVNFKSNDVDLVKESDTAKYGTGAFRLTKDKSGWLKDTRFK